MNPLAQSHRAPNSELAVIHHTGQPLLPSSFKHEKAKEKSEWCLIWQERLWGHVTMNRSLASTWEEVRVMKSSSIGGQKPRRKGPWVVASMAPLPPAQPRPHK